MKTVLKVIGIILLVIVGLIVALFVKAASTPAVPKGYTETVETGGEIEKTYLKNGPFATAWLMWQLQGDENAAKAFIEPQPELFGNPLYQEQRADLLEV